MTRQSPHFGTVSIIAMVYGDHNCSQYDKSNDRRFRSLMRLELLDTSERTTGASDVHLVSEDAGMVRVRRPSCAL